MNLFIFEHAKSLISAQLNECQDDKIKNKQIKYG